MVARKKNYLFDIFAKMKREIVKLINDTFWGKNHASDEDGFCVSLAEAETRVQNAEQAKSYFNERVDIVATSLAQYANTLCISRQWTAAVRTTKKFLVTHTVKEKRELKKQWIRFLKQFNESNKKSDVSNYFLAQKALYLDC